MIQTIAEARAVKPGDRVRLISLGLESYLLPKNEMGVVQAVVNWGNEVCLDVLWDNDARIGVIIPGDAVEIIPPVAAPPLSTAAPTSSPWLSFDESVARLERLNKMAARAIPGMPSTVQRRAAIEINVDNCARCGGNHPGLKFWQLNKPIRKWRLWGLCPVLNEPILLFIQKHGTRSPQMTVSIPGMPAATPPTSAAQ